MEVYLVPWEGDPPERMLEAMNYLRPIAAELHFCDHNLGLLSKALIDGGFSEYVVYSCPSSECDNAHVGPVEWGEAADGSSTRR